MKRWMELIFNKTFWRLLIFIVLAILVYRWGDQVSLGTWVPLKRISVRYLFIGALFILLLGPVCFQWLVQKISVGRLVHALKESIDRQRKERTTDTSRLEAMAKEFKSGIDVLRKRGGKTNLYSSPLYVVIGPPGAGKTTALERSGLRFLLQEPSGKVAMKGAGGTHNCEWFFADQAILLDTAGRYVSQDTDRHGDQQEWLAFLKLLAKYRPQQPINGVVLTMSLSSILSDSESAQQQHCQTIRSRLEELTTHLKIHIPVYFMITKIDLLQGFAEYFEDFDSEALQQVWGHTFNLYTGTVYTDTSRADPVNVGVLNARSIHNAWAQNDEGMWTRFTQEYDRLVAVITQGVIERLATESDPDRRAKIAGFPAQLNELRNRLKTFLMGIFVKAKVESSLDGHVLLRGFYFTSGTQSGNPLDRLTQKLVQRFALRTPVYPISKKPSRGYFLKNLYERVIFPEAGIAKAQSRLNTYLRHCRVAAVTVIVASSTAVLLVFAWNTYQNYHYTHQLRLALASLAPREGNPHAAYDKTVLLLQALELPQKIDKPHVLFGGIGLFQKPKIENSYQELLGRLYGAYLLPDVMRALESIIQTGMVQSGMVTSSTNRNERFEAAKVYAMLGKPEFFQAEFVKHYLEQSDFTRVFFNGRQKVEAGEPLGPQHMSTLVRHWVPSYSRIMRAENMTLMPLNEIDDTKQGTSIYYEHVKQKLKAELTAQGVKGFSVFDAGGPESESVFSRKTRGYTIKTAMSPLFTKKGYQRFKQKAQKIIHGQFEERQWVLNGAIKTQADLTRQLSTQSAIEAEIYQAVLNRYEEDYIYSYQRLLNDVVIRQKNTGRDVRHILEIVANKKTSPVKRFLSALREQTVMLDTPVSLASRGVAQAISEFWGHGGKQDGKNPEIRSNENRIAAYFDPLTRSIVRDDSGALPIDAVLDEVKNIEMKVGFIEDLKNQNRDVPPVLQEDLKLQSEKLTQQANKETALVKAFMVEVARQASNLHNEGQLVRLNQIWKERISQFCRTYIGARYPLNRLASNDVGMEEYRQFFSYFGLVDAFYNDHLASYVDASSSPWQNRSTSSGALKISTAALTFFEQAQRIREIYFKAGLSSNEPSFPSVSFSMMPRSIDSRLKRVEVEFGEKQKLIAGLFQPLAQRIDWSGEKPFETVILQAKGEGLVHVPPLKTRGPWALFRFFDQAQSITRQSQLEEYDVRFVLPSGDPQVPPYEIAYVLTFSGPFNPIEISKHHRVTCLDTL